MKSYIVPYTYIFSEPTIRDDAIRDMFRKMVRDGTLESVFFEGSVKTEDEFFEFVNRADNFLYGVYLKDDSIILGFIWLNMVSRKSARGHFCAFSEHWGSLAEIGHEVLVQLLTMKDEEDNFVLDAIFGFTPTNNYLALKATKLAGFRTAGILPKAFYHEADGISYDGVMMYYTRDEIPEEELKEQ